MSDSETPRFSRWNHAVMLVYCGQMSHDATTLPAYVIKTEDLPALGRLSPDRPQPLLYEWINRGTDQKLRRTTIQMLLRTLEQNDTSQSVARLHESSGLRVIFADEQDRDRFALAFAVAVAQEKTKAGQLLAATYDTREDAERVVTELTAAGIPEDSISVLWRAGEFVDENGVTWTGHTKRSVAAAVAGGGLAGAALGVAVLVVPGIGLVAAGGAIAASAYSSVAAVSAAIGATGGAMARMLTDNDVEGRDANYFEAQIRRGKVFVSVDTRVVGDLREAARAIMMRNGGNAPAVRLIAA